mgnify:CR=1 FL=1
MLHLPLLVERDDLVVLPLFTEHPVFCECFVGGSVLKHTETVHHPVGGLPFRKQLSERFKGFLV